MYYSLATFVAVILEQYTLKMKQMFMMLIIAFNWPKFHWLSDLTSDWLITINLGDFNWR